LKFCALIFVVFFSLAAFAAKKPVMARHGLLLNKDATTRVLLAPNVTALILFSSDKRKVVDLRTRGLGNRRWTTFRLIDQTGNSFARGFARVIGQHTFHLVNQLAKQEPRPTLESFRNVIDALEHPCEPVLLNPKSNELLVVEDQSNHG
jgi:hypothetical protein